MEIMRVFRGFLLIVAVAASFPALAGSFQNPGQKDKETPDDSILDEKILRDAKVAVDAPSLLKYFRDRTYKEADPKRLATLIAELGDAKFAVREKAYSDLLALGTTALAVLKEAANHSDEEIRKRAIELQLRIEERADPSVQAATARLIGHRKPEGAAEVLLNYLPFAADESVIDDIGKALTKVTLRDGKVEPVVTAAVKDKLAVKRAAAGAALATAQAKDHLEAARTLLKDAQPAVRLRVAHAFVLAGRDRDAVQVLIDCLKDLPPEKSWTAEELLLRMAGEKAPQVSLGTDEPTRLKCFQAWNDWWKDNGKKIDLAKIDFTNTLLGYTLVLYQNQPVAGKPFKACGWVEELDVAKNVRWKIEVPNLTMYASVVGPDRVLVVERQGQRVTERDFKGNVKWEKAIPGTNVLSAQRLTNGNTFIVANNMLVEYDPKGKEVYSYRRQNFDLYRGRKMRNGDVVIITNQGLVLRLDSKTNKELKSFKVGFLNNLYGTLEELPNGNLLIPQYQQNRVAEFDATGKEVWSVAVNSPSSATRLPNGNTLVSSLVGRRVAEYDRAGREVWSVALDGPVYVARKR
jgi:hypothetical protein